MPSQTKSELTGDASGRGSKAGFKVKFPARMRDFSEAEIDAVVQVMRNSECQTQGQYLKQFESDFKTHVGRIPPEHISLFARFARKLDSKNPNLKYELGAEDFVEYSALKAGISKKLISKEIANKNAKLKAGGMPPRSNVRGKEKFDPKTVKTEKDVMNLSDEDFAKWAEDQEKGNS